MKTRTSLARFVIPSVAVLAILAGGVALAAKAGLGAPAWLRSLLGESKERVSTVPFCREHEVPKAYCTLCHPELKATLLMCREHGVPEEICTLRHPEAARKHRMGPL